MDCWVMWCSTNPNLSLFRGQLGLLWVHGQLFLHINFAITNMIVIKTVLEIVMIVMAKLESFSSTVIAQSCLSLWLAWSSLGSRLALSFGSLWQCLHINFAITKVTVIKAVLEILMIIMALLESLSSTVIIVHIPQFTYLQLIIKLIYYMAAVSLMHNCEAV